MQISNWKEGCKSSGNQVMKLQWDHNSCMTICFSEPLLFQMEQSLLCSLFQLIYILFSFCQKHHFLRLMKPVLAKCKNKATTLFKLDLLQIFSSSGLGRIHRVAQKPFKKITVFSYSQKLKSGVQEQKKIIILPNIKNMETLSGRTIFFQSQVMCTYGLWIGCFQTQEFQGNLDRFLQN